MTWLILCDPRDGAALWAHERLSAAGVAPLELVTTDDLVGAGFEHWIDQGGASTIITLADGRILRSEEIRGTLNRMCWAPAADLALLPAHDREYGLQELHALYLSWLHALPDPVVNPPDHRGLCGAWRPQSQWADLGTRAGLPVREDVLGSGSDERGTEAWAMDDAIVVDGRVFSWMSLPPDVVAGCVRLAELAGTPILGVCFEEVHGEEPSFVRAGPLPDLRLGGEPLIGALADALQAGAGTG